MILHDEHCVEFEVEHTPGVEVNPYVWNFKRDDFGEVPVEHPVTGWRYATVHTYGDRVVWWDFFTSGSQFDGLPAAPEAKCRKNLMTTSAAGDYNFFDHEPGAPDPHCQCGYRIVHDVADIAPFLKWMDTDVDPYPVEQLPDEMREQLGTSPGDTVDVSVALVSVLGCGDTAACDFKTYFDPDDTLRVQWVAATPTVLTADDCVAVPALEAFGAEVTTVDSLFGVHEPDRCENSTAYALWKLQPLPEPHAGEVVLREGRESASGEGWTRAGRWGVYGSAGVAISHEGKVLLVRSGGRWQLPGGARNRAESAGECVVREAREEIRADVTGLEVTGAFRRGDVSGWEYTTITVLGWVDASPGAEVSEVGWFEVPPADCHPDLVEVWPRLL